MKQLSLRKGFAFAAALLLVGAAIAVAVATHGSGSTIARTDLTRIAKRVDPDAQAIPRTHPARALTSVDRPRRSGRTRRIRASDIPFGAQVDALRSYQHLNATYRDVAADPGPERCRGQSVDVGRSVEGGIPGRPDVLRRRLHRRRADHGARHPPALLRGRLHAVPRRSRRRHLAHDQRPRAPGHAELAVHLRLVRIERDRRHELASLTTRRSTSARASRMRRATPRPVSASGGPTTAATRGRTSRRSPTPTASPTATTPATRSPAAPSARSSPNRATRRASGSASTRAVRGVASVTGNATSTRRRRGLRSASTTRPTAARRSTSSGTATAAFAASATSRSIRVTPTSSTQRRHSQGTWRSDNGGDTWTLIKEPLVPQSIDNAVRRGDRRHEAAERQHAAYTWPRALPARTQVSRRPRSGGPTTRSTRRRRAAGPT